MTFNAILNDLCTTPYMENQSKTIQSLTLVTSNLQFIEKKFVKFQGEYFSKFNAQIYLL